MGIDACVMCNCLRDGKTTDPPYPREWLTFDEEGELTLVAEHDTDERWHNLRRWQQSCCEHENMDQVSTHIANWSGYRRFQQALESVGWKKFPVLQKELPNANGGLSASDQSKLALSELRVFQESGVIGEKTVLIKSSTNEEIYYHIAAYEGVFILSGSRGVDIGVEETEIFVKDRETGEILFQAQRIRQFKNDDTPILNEDDNVIWENLDTGDIYDSGVAIGGHLVPWDNGELVNSEGKVRQDYPSELHVEVRPLQTEEFLDIIRPLKAVFSASAETGNPVKWF